MRASLGLPARARDLRLDPFHVFVAAILAVLAVVAVWNEYYVRHYVGYDWLEHFEYAETVVPHGIIPSAAGGGEYYTPPLFYGIFGAAYDFAQLLGTSRPDKVARALNVPLLLGTAVLVLLIARTLWPERRRLHVAALAFFSLLPVVVKLGAMFHPETLSLFLSTLAVYLAVRMLARRDFRVHQAVLLGAALGAAQLVRAFTLATFAAVVLGLLAAGAVGYVRPSTLLATAGVVVATTALVTAPWYIRQAVKYGNPVFSPKPPVTKPLWERRPLSFYTALGLPEVFTDPIRPNFVNDALPTVYSDIWGDYFGAYVWAAGTTPEPKVKRQLVLQNVIGLVPSALALAGFVALLVTSVRRRTLRRQAGLLPVALLPLLTLLAFLYFVVGYPTSDGDVLKATYMLIAAPGWALAFAYAFDWLARDRLVRLGLVPFLLFSALIDLGFLLYQSSLTGLF